MPKPSEEELNERAKNLDDYEKSLDKKNKDLKEKQAQLMQQRQDLATESQRLNAERQKLEGVGVMAQVTQGYLGTLEAYEEGDDWTSWMERLQLCFDANEIKDTKKQVAILLTTVGKKWYTLIKNLCLP